MTQAKKPEDILADELNSAVINGVAVRKGTVAAFMANIDVIESADASDSLKEEAFDILKELAPAIVAIGLHNHVTFKNAEAEALLVETAKQLV